MRESRDKARNAFLATFQLNIAKNWRRRGQSAKDVFCKFFYFFSGFNALYFLWSQTDDLKDSDGKPVREDKQIRHMLSKFSEEEASCILARQDFRECADYFGKRGPIQRMDRRDPADPALGEVREGKKWCTMLTSSQRQQERLQALGSILYLVRCNLVHGSKTESGDDKEIIRHAGAALSVLLDETLKLTDRSFP